MENDNRIAADMIAIYFAGRPKTAAELRTAIQALADTTLFTTLDVERIARVNEATQGIKMF